MKHNIKLLWLFSINSMKITLQHRVGVISFLTGKIIRFTFYFLFIYFLVSRTKLLAGYTLNQTLVFFLTFNFIDSLAQLLFREVYRFRPLIISGEFDSVLLKPIHPFLRVLVGGIDILDAFTIIPYFGLLAYFIFLVPQVSLISLMLYIGFVFNAMVLATSFHILILAIAILTAEIDHMIMIYRDFTRMVSFPIDIYREPFKSFLMFVIPVGIMMALPVKILFGLASYKILMVSGIISVVFVMLSVWLWKKALEKYQSVGS